MMTLFTEIPINTNVFLLALERRRDTTWAYVDLCLRPTQLKIDSNLQTYICCCRYSILLLNINGCDIYMDIVGLGHFIILFLHYIYLN